MTPGKKGSASFVYSMWHLMKVLVQALRSPTAAIDQIALKVLAQEGKPEQRI